MSVHVDVLFKYAQLCIHMCVYSCLYMWMCCSYLLGVHAYVDALVSVHMGVLFIFVQLCIHLYVRLCLCCLYLHRYGYICVYVGTKTGG